MVKVTHVVHATAVLVAGMGWDRMILAVLILVAVTVLVVTGDLPSEAAVGIYSAVLGYVVGAGHEAAKPTPPTEG